MRSVVFHFKSLWERLRHGVPLIRFVPVDDIPDQLENNRLYVAGEVGRGWLAAMICPCGCGERLLLNMVPGGRAVWRATRHADLTPTLHPSVDRVVGCRSHFFLRRGRIQWCGGSRS